MAGQRARRTSHWFHRFVCLLLVCCHGWRHHSFYAAVLLSLSLSLPLFSPPATACDATPRGGHLDRSTALVPPQVYAAVNAFQSQGRSKSPVGRGAERFLAAALNRYSSSW